MLRGKKQYRPAQASLQTLSVIIVALLLLMVFESNGREEDFKVDWNEPVYLTVEEVSISESNSSFILLLRLWDEESAVTEWNGILGIQLLDEAHLMILETTLEVTAEDFTTVRREGYFDTHLLIEVPFSALDHVTAGIVTHPEMELGIKVTFETAWQVITETVNWWPTPTYVKVENHYLDNEEGWILMDVYLFDDIMQSTRWSGDLRIIIRDSLGFDMYNDTEYIEARDFNKLIYGPISYTWYRTWVLFEDIRLSRDRLGNGSDDGTYGCMTVIAWFEFDGVVLKQVPDGLTAKRNTGPIPETLLAENTPPDVRLTAERLMFTGSEHVFDASGTRDDLGNEGLLYLWSWGDGSGTEMTNEPYAYHSFTRPGSFEVELTVEDVEGATSSIIWNVDVLWDPRSDIDIGDDTNMDGSLMEDVTDHLRDAR